MLKQTKIAHINTVSYPRNSVASVMLSVHEASVLAGVDSKVFVARGPKRENTIVLQNPVQRYGNALTARLRGDDGFLPFSTVRRLIAQLDAFSPDLVHVHNLHGYYMDIVPLLDWVRSREIPVMFTLHDLWLATGRCAVPADCQLYFSHDCSNCPKPTCYPGKWQWTDRLPKSLRKRDVFYKDHLLSPLNAHLVAPSTAMARIIEATTLSHLPVSVIENGVDPSIFNPQSLDENHAERKDKGALRLIAVSSQWTMEKNPGALLSVIAEMPTDWHMTIIGKRFPTDSLPKHLRHSVTIVDDVESPTRLAQYYRASDALLSPSLSESFGMTVAEANACGVPAVVNLQATPAINPYGNNILSVDFAYPHAVIGVIKNAVHREVDTSKVTTITEMQKKYLLLYQQILSNG